MTQQRRLKQRLASQGEISEILAGMKNLAYLETRKLLRLLDNQSDVMEQFERVARDFLSFNPRVLPQAETDYRVYLVIGSRRGFCGDFNQRLGATLAAELAAATGTVNLVIAVGHKLCRRLEGSATVTVGLEGADVAEEIPGVLHEIVRELDSHQPLHTAMSLKVLYQSPRGREPLRQQLLPPFADAAVDPPEHGFPPLLNLAPREFLLGLVEQYLYAALHMLLYTSLLAENERRMRHLDGAVRHLEERAEAIQRRLRALRQEEIIEEIEVILLNAAGLDDPISRSSNDGKE